MRSKGFSSRVFSSVFIIAPDKGFFDIGVCDVDTASCDSIVGSFDYTVICSEGDVFLCREVCSLTSDDGVEVAVSWYFVIIPSNYC